MDCLLDNNVPRSVTHLLRDRGWGVVEVRDALAPDAPDADVLAYARATGRILITHDRGLVRRARAAGHPLVWLRTGETDDRDRLAVELPEIEAALDRGACEIQVFKRELRIL